jgi:hypothetical protein
MGDRWPPQNSIRVSNDVSFLRLLNQSIGFLPKILHCAEPFAALDRGGM